MSLRCTPWLATLAVLLLAGCGDEEGGQGGEGGGAGGGRSVTVYSSLPLQGAQRPQTTDMVKGIELALEQVGGKAGDVTVKYQSLDDSTAQADKNPNPYAIYGYEAMRLALDAIERSGTGEKADIVKALFESKDRESVLGTYSVDKNGDTSLTDYGIYSIDGGELQFDQTIKAATG